MLDSLINTLEFFPRGIAYVVLGIVMLVLSKVFQDAITRYSINEQINDRKNVALGLSITGYYLGVIIVFVGILFQPLSIVRDDHWYFTKDFAWSFLEVLIYSLIGILLLNAARYFVDKLVLYKFDTEKEIVEDKNIGTAAVEFGIYVSVGLVIAAACAGTGNVVEDNSVSTVVDSATKSLVFFGLGMLVLALFTVFYEMTTSFNIHEEIEKDNPAVGIALGGNLIGIGIVVFKSVFGEFVGWTESLVAFLVFAVIGFILLYVVRILIDYALLPGIRVSKALANDKNIAVAFVESAVIISAALILYFAI